tara:strand:+ start:184 stop:948 length:765 start_codon:yes stop_codon:yes gene_type:complete
MGYFPTNNCSISSANLTPSEKDVVQTVMDGNAFQNPVAGSINSVNTAISSATSLISSATFPDIFNGLSGALNGLSGQVGDYQTHSNRISGKNIGALGPNDEPGLLGLYGIASAFNSAQETMVGGVVDNFSQVFGSILGPADSAIKSVTDTIENSISLFIQDNLGVSSGNYPVGFVDNLNNFTTEIAGASAGLGTLINNDNAAYSSALNYVEKFGLGNMVLGSQNDPCFGGHLIKGVVANSNLQQKLNDLPTDNT